MPKLLLAGIQLPINPLSISNREHLGKMDHSEFVNSNMFDAANDRVDDESRYSESPI